jgi:hypothetical protein
VESQAAAFIDWTLSRQGFGDAVFHSDFAERRPLADNGILRLAAVIRAGQEAGAFGPVDPDPTARLLFAVIHEAADAVAGGADRAGHPGGAEQPAPPHPRALAPGGFHE